MWSKSVFSVLFLSSLIAGFNGQSFEMTCRFETTRIMDIEGYSCLVSALDYNFNSPNYQINVVGNHAAGMTNDDVRLIRITNSRINRIPPNIFNAFPNAEALEVLNCGNITMTAPDFSSAGNLKIIHFQLNNIPRIEANTFVAATSLEALYLDNNRIEDLGPAPFTGLTNLVHISLGNNQIRNLHPNILNILPNLRIFAMADNQLQQVDGRLFANNPNLISVNLAGNQIFGIGASFLDINDRIAFLFMQNNNCVDHEFIGVKLDDIRAGLAVCFANSQ